MLAAESMQLFPFWLVKSRLMRRWNQVSILLVLKYALTQPQSTIVTEVFYCPAIACVKFSVLLLYRRIFPNPRLRIIIWCLGAFILCYSLVLSFCIIFQCKPIRGAWDPMIDAKCFNLKIVILLTSSLNVFTDVLTLCLPLPLLWRLKLPKEKKVQLTGIFLLGGLYVPVGPMLKSKNTLLTAAVLSVCFASLYRTTQVKNVSLEDAPCMWIFYLVRYPKIALTGADRVRCRRSDLVNRRIMCRNLQCMPPSFSSHLQQNDWSSIQT